MLRKVLIVAGVLAILFGGLFFLQGLGVVRWPSESFMIDRRVWVLRGAIVAGIGVVLAFAARFVRGGR